MNNETTQRETTQRETATERETARIPDMSQATEEQFLNALLAMRPGQPEGALEAALGAIPEWKASGEGTS